jgi:hypothetical protein
VIGIYYNHNINSAETKLGRIKKHGTKVNNLVQYQAINTIQHESDNIDIFEVNISKKQGKKRRRILETDEDRKEARQEVNQAYWNRNKNEINEKRKENRKKKHKVFTPSGSHNASIANLVGSINDNKFVATSIEDMISQYKKDVKPIQTLWIRGDGLYATLQSSNCRQKKSTQVEKYHHEFLQRMTNLVSALGGWTADKGREAILQLKDVVNIIREHELVKKAYQKGVEEGQKEAMKILTNHWKNVTTAITKGMLV